MSTSESESISNAEYESLSQKIIMEVKKRPGLYDNTLRPYTDRNAKSLLWEEVYQHVVSNWTKLSQAEKLQRGITIQKKWKNMRDSFAKELALQRERRRSGQGAIKKRKYIHFDSMMFLVPSLQKRETSSKKESPENNHSTTPSQGNLDVDVSEHLQTNSNQTLPFKKISSNQSHNNAEQKLSNSSNTETNSNEYDEDINFSQMLVPMLRKLDDDQKHFAKVEIMNVLHKAKSV